jgi:hypothetical protein
MSSCNFAQRTVDLAVINRRLAFLADPWGNLVELAQALA